MPRRVTPYRNGLNAWHHAHTHTLLTQLLARPVVPAGKKRGRELLTMLAERFTLPPGAILSVFDILTVTRTASGSSFHKSEAGAPVEFAINWGQLEHYEVGGEVAEYASFADDPIIGSRWVQNIDEALLMAIGHELAHFLVTLRVAKGGDDIVDTKPHGTAFVETYRLIRELGVNPMLSENAASEVQQAAARHEAKLLRKLQALRKMASDTTSNEHEAERALRQLQSLLAKYGLSDAGYAQNTRPHLIERTVPVLKQGRYKALTHYCHAISQFCGVEAVIHTRHWPATSTKASSGRRSASATEYASFFGAPSDVEMAVYLSELLYHSLTREEGEFKASQGYRAQLDRGRHAASLLASFREAFSERVCERLALARESVENSWVNAQAANGALMVAKDAALREAFKKRYPRIGTHRRTASAARTIAAARSAGVQAAERVNLSRPVAGREIKRLQ